MSMAFTNVLEVKQWLSERYIQVPLNWVEACVQFLTQEFSASNFPLQRLKNAVYEQWLAADLEEICSPTLPAELCYVQKTSLDGRFTLQVNAIRDVGKPAYAQLRQLEGKINEDVEVSAAPKAFVPEWESKPTRMLILNLTDGVNLIQGMEYKPIKSLSPNLSPGVKVLIKGPVDCRLGMLLLTADKIDILGGEVEKYRQKYSREEVLREALQINNSAAAEPSENTEAVSPMQASQESRNPVFDNDDDVFVARRPRMPDCSPFINPSRTVDLDLPRERENFEADDDDFVQDLDYNALDEIERINSQRVTANTIDSENEDEDMLREAYEFQGKSDSVSPQHMVRNVSVSEPSPCTTVTRCSSPVSFTCLSDVPESVRSSSEFSITIKGFISKVLSRLECKALGGWHLTAKVGDGTSTLDADFHDKVLERFVGMSAKEMMAMQIQARENADVKSKMMEAIGMCKKKLQELNCLMEIKFSTGKMPCVMKCSDVLGLS